MQPAGGMVEGSPDVFQVDVNAPVEDGGARALVRLVQCQRQIQGHHEDIVAQLAQPAHERIVTDAVSAIHGSRSRRQLDDPHGRRAPFAAKQKTVPSSDPMTIRPCATAGEPLTAPPVS